MRYGPLISLVNQRNVQNTSQSVQNAFKEGFMMVLGTTVLINDQAKQWSEQMSIRIETLNRNIKKEKQITLKKFLGWW